MANIDLHRAKTDAQISQIDYRSLDCLVNWLHILSVDNDNQLYGFEWVFRSGSPYKFPSGEFGYDLWGDVGIHKWPIPLPNHHRVSGRMNPIPRYSVKFGGIWRVQSVHTDFYMEDYINYDNPEIIIAAHLAALARSIPNYLRYLVYKTFVGTEAAKENWYLKDWMVKYIEPADGNTAGYDFMNSEGYAAVNLKEVIDKKKVTENTYKKKLEEINKKIRDNARKIEVDVDQNSRLKTDWPKKNLTDRAKKTLAMIDRVRSEVRRAIRNGQLDIKYKYNNDANHLEGYMPGIQAGGGLIAVFNKAEILNLVDELTLVNPVKEWDLFSGFECPVSVSDIIDGDEAFVFMRDAIQYWILQDLIRYSIHEYRNEYTRDFIYEMAHTLNTVDIFGNMYFKLKSS